MRRSHGDGVAGASRTVVAEALLAVQQLRESGSAFRSHQRNAAPGVELGREEERRRRRQVRIAGSLAPPLRRCRSDLSRRSPWRRTAAGCFSIGQHRRGQLVADQFLVDHVASSFRRVRTASRRRRRREPRLCCRASRAPSTWRLSGAAAQLLDQLGALRQAGGAQRMALAQQAARRVGDDLAAVGVVAVDDEFLGAADRAQAERLVAEQLVLREAVVQLDDVDVLAGRRRPLRRPAAPRPAPC